MFESYNDILLALSLLLCIFISFHAILLRKKVGVYSSKLQATAATLSDVQKELEKLKGPKDQVPHFELDLHRAEMKTQLQHFSFSRQDQHPDTPERYQYIHSLTQKGLTGEDIAAILTISPQEADQLVTLSQLAHK